MGIEESLSQIKTVVHDGDFSVSIKFNRLERQFDPKNRILLLYSDIEYIAENFSWKSTVPTVRIPYRDPSLGFLIDGVIFSSVGIYSRAPGVVPDIAKRSVGAKIVEEPKVDIVNARNSTISIGYKRNAIHVIFKRNSKEYKVPIGVFLKAISNLPYAEILKKFAYKPQALLNAFPCEIPKGNEDLSGVSTYGIESYEEPSIEDCVDLVYSAITHARARQDMPKYTTHWKVNRINVFLNNLHFKTRSRYESTLSVGHRAVGTYLDEDIDVPYFSRTTETIKRRQLDGSEKVETTSKEEIKHFTLPKGHYITDDDARELCRYDISAIRVKTTRSFILQEDSPMYFRIKGYKLVEDIPELEAKAGDIIDDELLEKINNLDIHYLEVYAPSGRKVVHRSGEGVEIGDFYSILNYLLTHSYMQETDATQYEVSNRIILDYEYRVVVDVEQTYQDIVSAIMGSTELKNLLDAFPYLPTSRLIHYLRDADNKEVTQADITNVMSRAISDSKSSAGMKGTPPAMMPVQKGQYGRFDSFHAPDSDKVGSVQQMTIMARINSQTGEVEAPYEKIINGEPTGKIEYITASKENNKYIVSWDCKLDTPTVLARFNDDITTVSKEKVDYRDPSPFCDMSVSRMTIPFPGFSQPKRALMATKMNGQALPVLFPERAMVSTGADTEVPSLYYTGRQILEACNIQVTDETVLELVGTTWEKNTVEYKFIYDSIVFSFSIPFTATDKESLYYYNLRLTGGTNKYGLDEVVLYNQNCDIKDYDFWTRIDQGAMPCFKDHTKPALALGVNLVVGYKTYGSTTVDDALVISDRLIADNVFSSIQIFKYEYKLKQDESFSETKWCPPLHSHVYTSQPVISILRTKKNKTEQEERECLCKQEGEVVYAHKDDNTKEAEVWVATLHQVEIGDKTAGRYGNKSVTAKIVPHSMMPYDPETGLTLDVVCTPLGLPSRMNFGQILEVALGAVMLKQSEQGKKKIAVCTPFYPNIKDEIVNLYNSEGLKPVRLFNPVYGKLTDRPVMTGVMYIMKLEQISNLKISAVGYPRAVDPVFGQPVDSLNQNKGQAVGEMESWALIASGAHGILDSFYSWYADDEEARRSWFKALEDSQDEWDESPLVASRHSVNKNALVTQLVMRMFSCDIDVKDNRYVISPLDLEDIPITFSAAEFINGYERVQDFEWFKVKLGSEVINPFWIRNFPLHLVLGIKSVKNLIAGKAYLDISALNDRENCIIPASDLTSQEKERMRTGISAVIELVKNTSVEDAITRMMVHYNLNGVDKLNDDGGDNSDDSDTVFSGVVLDENDMPALDIFGDIADVPMSTADAMRFLRRIKDSGKDLSIIIWDHMPIMPRIFRQSTLMGGKSQEHSFQKQLKNICSSRATSQSIYEGLLKLIGYGETKKDDLVSIRGYFFGHGSQSGQHGKVRGSVLSKRVGFSGRVVIVPMEDPSISPFFVGLPWRVVCTELGEVLGLRLKKLDTSIATDLSEKTTLTVGQVTKLEFKAWQTIAASLGEYNPYLLQKYFPKATDADLYVIYYYLRSLVKKLVEGEVSNDGMVKIDGEWKDPAQLPKGTTIGCAVVTSGRQPTLHKKSIRSYFVKLVDGYCMRIHPIVCKGYNADFDGDTMWHIQLFGDDKIEACKTLSVLQDLISEKDGSYTLDLAQDVVLGIYCATTYKDNAATFVGSKGDFYYFDDIEELRTQLEYGDLHYYEAVVYTDPKSGSTYCSTAGRILINALVPGCLTQRPFSDHNGIAKAVLGDTDTSNFKDLLHDTVWTATSIRPKGRSEAVKIDDILLDTYNSFGPRESVKTAQALYEVGLIASDVVSVSITLDDMSSDIDMSQYMREPRKAVAQLNDLYQLGLLTEDSRKSSAVHAWDTAKTKAQDDIIASLDPNSNTFMMMYSGARGKPAQVMQSIGFIGTISKTNEVDIEYPILRGYGQGLSSFDLMQTRHSARIGVISTQAGTKDTGYATRQSVYMMSGLAIKGEDCGIEMCISQVEKDTEGLQVQWPDGSLREFDSLLGEFVVDSTERFEELKPLLNQTGYMINERVLDLIQSLGLTSVTLLGRHNTEQIVKLVYKVSDEWRQQMLEEGYSYALPYTDGMKITEKTINWVVSSGLTEIVAFSRLTYENNQYFDLEAYLPVDYDTSQYTITLNDKPVDGEVLFALAVNPESEGFHYYRNILAEGNIMTKKALDYLTKKKIHEVKFTDGSVAHFRYGISSLFKDVVLGRVSAGLLYLDKDNCITAKTLEYIEEFQFSAIPVRTGLTCLAEGGICMRCYGKSLSSKTFMKNGDNLGIAASQAMCEPLSQATLNVGHSGGKRGSGTGLVSGLTYYTRMLRGSMVTKSTASLIERFAAKSGYVRRNPYNHNFVQIVDDDGAESILLDDPERLNVPDGAYVDVCDTIVSGLPDLDRYDSTNVFDAALKTRYLLMKEYNKVFSALSVSARNTEVLARAQTSICYLVGKGSFDKTKDTGLESRDQTGNYKLMVSAQLQVVNWYTGIAGYGFQDVANMVLMGLFTPEGLPLNSCLGNIITGTKVGSTKAKFLPKSGGSKATKYHKSAYKEMESDLKHLVDTNSMAVRLQLTSGGYSAEDEEKIFGKLMESQQGFTALPEVGSTDIFSKGEPLALEADNSVDPFAADFTFETVGVETEETSAEESPFVVEVVSAEEPEKENEDKFDLVIDVVSTEVEETERENQTMKHSKSEDLHRIKFD